MSIEQFISVFSLIIACIALGYTIGKFLLEFFVARTLINRNSRPSLKNRAAISQM